MLVVDAVTPDVDVSQHVDALVTRARERLDGRTESGLAEIEAWRRAFAAMGLRPTQYRCAAEALLRRLRREGDLPQLHPLVDLCNALSAAFAVPVAALDLERTAGDVTVRPATGDESYLSFSGELEQPAAGEIVYADTAGHAHARRWTHRQSGLSAVRDATTSVLVVAEAMHAGADADLTRLADQLVDAVPAPWLVGTPVLLHPDQRRTTMPTHLAQFRDLTPVSNPEDAPAG